MNVVEPSSYEEAKEYEEWRDAMNEEYNSIMKNDTWECHWYSLTGSNNCCHTNTMGQYHGN